MEVFRRRIWGGGTIRWSAAPENKNIKTRANAEKIFLILTRLEFFAVNDEGHSIFYIYGERKLNWSFYQEQFSEHLQN